MLADDSTLDVHSQSGKLGELRVEIDGETAIKVPQFGYPRPRTLLHEIRTCGIPANGQPAKHHRGASSLASSDGRMPARLRLYSDLAAWWPLMSPPSHYVEEAEDLLPMLLAAPDAPPRTLLELGAGGGSLAFHLKDHFRLTLSDRSPDMLAVSRATNPECEHLLGDMRALDLGRNFDLVLIHDAIMYATDPCRCRRHWRLRRATAAPEAEW